MGRSSDSSSVEKKKSKHKRKFTEKSHILPEHKPRLREILNCIEDHPFAIEFRDPYPWKRKQVLLSPSRVERDRLPRSGPEALVHPDAEEENRGALEVQAI